MLIKVKAFTEAGKEEVVARAKDSFEVWTKARPLHGQANRAIAFLLAKYFHLSINQVKLLKGAKRRSKVFKLDKEWS